MTQVSRLVSQCLSHVRVQRATEPRPCVRLSGISAQHEPRARRVPSRGPQRTELSYEIASVLSPQSSDVTSEYRDGQRGRSQSRVPRVPVRLPKHGSEIEDMLTLLFGRARGGRGGAIEERCHDLDTCGGHGRRICWWMRPGRWGMPEILGVPWVTLCKTQVSAVSCLWCVDRGSSMRVSIDAAREVAWPRIGLAHGFKLLPDI